MEYFYRSKELWDILCAVQNEMIRRNDDEDPIRQLVNDTVIQTITRVKCEISYYGFQGLLVSDTEIAEKLQPKVYNTPDHGYGIPVITCDSTCSGVNMSKEAKE